MSEPQPISLVDMDNLDDDIEEGEVDIELDGEEFDDLFTEKINEPDVPKKSKGVAKGAGKFLWIFSFISIIFKQIKFCYILKV